LDARRLPSLARFSADRQQLELISVTENYLKDLPVALWNSRERLTHLGSEDPVELSFHFLDSMRTTGNGEVRRSSRRKAAG